MAAIGYAVAGCVVLLFFVLSMFSMEFPMVTPDHFRTNIFTGQCEMGGGSGNSVRDPWYYSEGCTEASKKAVLEQNSDYQFWLQKCETYCNSQDSHSFCSEMIKLGGRIGLRGCSEIMKCEFITDC